MGPWKRGLIKRMPDEPGAGRKVTREGVPLCRPIPSRAIDFFIVFRNIFEEDCTD